MFLKICIFALLGCDLVMALKPPHNHALRERVSDGNKCSSYPSNCPGRVKPRDIGRAVGAFEDNIENVPFVVSLQWNGYHFCVGTVLNAYTILTSAKCVKNIQVDDLPLYSIRAGSADHRSAGQSVRLASVRHHPDYNASLGQNDVAVIKLIAPLTLDATVQAALLPKKQLKLQDFTWVLSSGWGVANYEGPGTTRLQTIIVPIVSNKKCVDWYGNEFDAKHQLCLAEEARATCQGDSGSALILNKTIVGLITYTSDCPDMPTPAKYTRVEPYVAWIQKSLKSKNCIN